MWVMVNFILHTLLTILIHFFLLISLCLGAISPHALAENKPNRIISLSPSLTEILFTIGAAPQVIAVDSQSNFPKNVPRTNLSAYEPNLEAIASFKPDLVVLSYDIGDSVKGLNLVGIDTLLLSTPKNFSEILTQIMVLGKSTGNTKKAKKLIIDMEKKMSRLTMLREKRRAIKIYHEVDENYYSASSFSFIGSIYRMLNLTNIADEADKEGYGYPKLSPEYIISSNPDLIILPGKTSDHILKMIERPGWKHISAVKNNKFLRIESDIASRWGPRLTEFANSIVDFLEPN